MEIIDIPFVKKTGVLKSGGGELELHYGEDVLNHFRAICAGAQYTLAEASSGDFLKTLYPDLVGRVMPVIRETKIRYRKPALTSITAVSSVSKESYRSFEEQFSCDGRGFISIDVKVKDLNNNLTCTAAFLWFVQKL